MTRVTAFAVLYLVSVGCTGTITDPDDTRDSKTRSVLGTVNKPLVHTLSGWVIADELIVGVGAATDAEALALATSVNGELVFRGIHTGYCVLRFADMRAANLAMRRLLVHPLVVEVGRNHVLAGTGIGTTPFEEQWNIRALNLAFDDNWGSAAGVRVAILDSGIAYENYSDASGDYAVAPNLAGVTFGPGHDFVNDDAHANDDQGHGTHIAGIIASSGGTLAVAPGAELLPVKVLDQSNQGTELALAEGIRFATDNGAKVINMSLSFAPSYFPSRYMQAAIDYAVSNGVVLVAAVGNDGQKVVTYPAAFRDVIAVGATKLKKGFKPKHNDPWKKAHKSQRVTEYSNTGMLVDIVAPGGTLAADVDDSGNPEGILAQSFSGDPTQFDYYFWAGTSQATAHASAIAAVMLAENPDLLPGDVRALLGDSANQKGNKILRADYGRGRLDADAAIDAADDSDATDTRPQYYVGMRVTMRKAGATKRRAYAEVQVVDEDGNPVGGITVYGTFTGGVYHDRKGKTNSDGEVTFKSARFSADSAVVAFQVNAVSMKKGGVKIFDRPHGQIHIDSCSLNNLTQFAEAAGIGTTPGGPPPPFGLTPIAVKFDVPGAHPKEIATVTLLNFSWGLATVPMVVAVEESFFKDTFPNASDVTVISFGTGIGTTPIVITPTLSFPFIPEGFVDSTECVDLVVRTFSSGAGIGTTPYSPVMPAPSGNCQNTGCASINSALQDMWLAYGTGIGTTPNAGDYPSIPVAKFNALLALMERYAKFGQWVDSSPVASYGTVLSAAGLAVTPITGGSGNGTGSVLAN